MRAAGGLTFGESPFLGNYQLGGSFGDASFAVTPDGSRMLRGYPIAVDIGDMYWLGSLEYRFPLWRMERGFGTFPVYNRTVSGAVFVDTGNAFVNPNTGTGLNESVENVAQAAIQDPLLGVGGELVVRWIVFYRVGLQVRIGYAIGLSDPGFKPSDGIAAAYARIGGSF
jgi:hypothetical protein